MHFSKSGLPPHFQGRRRLCCLHHAVWRYARSLIMFLCSGMIKFIWVCCLKQLGINFLSAGFSWQEMRPTEELKTAFYSSSSVIKRKWSFHTSVKTLLFQDPQNLCQPTGSSSGAAALTQNLLHHRSAPQSQRKPWHSSSSPVIYPLICDEMSDSGRQVLSGSSVHFCSSVCAWKGRFVLVIGPARACLMLSRSCKCSPKNVAPETEIITPD